MFYDDVKVSDERSYGFGWGVMNNYPEPVVSHGGLVENYITHMFILPESEIAGVIFINENDYLVTNEMTGTILYGVLAMLFDEEPTYIGASTYVVKHLLWDGLSLLIICTCIVPLVLLGKWKKRLYYGSKVKMIIGFLFFHIVIPTGLLCVPAILETPAFVIRSFVLDLYIVLVASAVIAYGTGLLKLLFISKKLQKSGNA